MIFQAIDDNRDCVGVYVDGELVFDELPANLSKTWKYAATTRRCLSGLYEARLETS